MRSILWLAVFPSMLCAAPGAPATLAIVRPAISQMDGGAPEPAGFEHAPGETMFFTCRIAGYAKTSDEKVQLTYSVQAFDPQGVPLSELYKNEITQEVTAQDKEWLPKIETEIAIPPLVASGAYKIVVKAEDVVGKTSAELEVPFQVRGHEVAASDTLVVRNFRFLRREDDAQALEKPVYKPGDTVWARFDITGFKYGPNNKVDVSYAISILGAAGKVLWTQPEPAMEQSESFYPKRYVAADFNINLQGDIRPGPYTIAVAVKDAAGNQTCEGKYIFTVE